MIIYLISIVIAASCADWTQLNDIINQGILERAYPGAVIAVANESSIIYQKAYGYLTYQHDIHQVGVTTDTKYDVASITKVMGTSLAIMNLLSSNTIKLTDLVSKYITNYDTNKKGQTKIANLLLHNAGLPYDLPGKLPTNKSQLIQAITFIKLDYPIGTKFQYSNLGYIMLGEIISVATKKSLTQYFSQNRIFAGLTDTGFNPPQSQLYRIAPTQYDAQIRKDIVRGQAHQRLAYVMNGVAGHSGYFTTADDLIRYMQILMNKGKLPKQTRVLPQAQVNLFINRVTGLPYQNTRAYGFDTTCPSILMKDCFGHNGSTGIMAWADLQKKIAFVVLTNRGHPDVKNNKFFSIYSQKIANAVISATLKK